MQILYFEDIENFDSRSNEKTRVLWKFTFTVYNKL